jgi:hypothetical protein
VAESATVTVALIVVETVVLIVALVVIALVPKVEQAQVGASVATSVADVPALRVPPPQRPSVWQQKHRAM